MYPITTEFEKLQSTLLDPVVVKLAPVVRVGVQDLFVNMMHDIGEYEHGSVDVDDVFEERSLAYVADRALVRMYANVCEDVLRSYLCMLKDDVKGLEPSNRYNSEGMKAALRAPDEGRYA